MHTALFLILLASDIILKYHGFIYVVWKIGARGNEGAEREIKKEAFSTASRALNYNKLLTKWGERDFFYIWEFYCSYLTDLGKEFLPELVIFLLGNQFAIPASTCFLELIRRVSTYLHRDFPHCSLANFWKGLRFLGLLFFPQTLDGLSITENSLCYPQTIFWRFVLDHHPKGRPVSAQDQIFWRTSFRFSWFHQLL